MAELVELVRRLRPTSQVILEIYGDPDPALGGARFLVARWSPFPPWQLVPVFTSWDRTNQGPMSQAQLVWEGRVITDWRAAGERDWRGAVGPAAVQELLTTVAEGNIVEVRAWFG